MSTIPESRTADAPREPALLTHDTALAVDTAPHGVPVRLGTLPPETTPHGLPEADPDCSTDTAPHGLLTLDPAGDGPPPLSPMTGLPVITAADILAGHTGQQEPATDDTEPPADGPAVVERDEPEPRPRRGRRRAPRSMVRRFAPVTVGAAAVLVAGMVALLLRPVSDEGPDLSASLVSSDTAQSPSTTGIATLPAPGALSSALDQARDNATTTTPPPATTAEQQRAGGVTNRARGPVAAVSDGVTAAAKLGWNLVGGDEFAGGLGNWGVYDGAGHGGNGRRTPGAVTVTNGLLTIRGDSNGNTGGVAWGDDQRFGKWEMRAKFPSGDEQYHPVLILWPEGDNWPQGGEVDFAETNSAADGVQFFLHYGANNNQVSDERKLDITQWHNYAVEWTANGITGYIDGVPWFHSGDGNTLPPGKMHATIQLDYFPNGGNPRPTEMQVDWMRIYS